MSEVPAIDRRARRRDRRLWSPPWPIRTLVAGTVGLIIAAVHPSVAILGAGSMGTILAEGLLRAGWEPGDVVMAARRPERASETERLTGVSVVLDPAAAAKRSGRGRGGGQAEGRARPPRPDRRRGGTSTTPHLAGCGRPHRGLRAPVPRLGGGPLDAEHPGRRRRGDDGVLRGGRGRRRGAGARRRRALRGRADHQPVRGPARRRHRGVRHRPGLRVPARRGADRGRHPRRASPPRRREARTADGAGRRHPARHQPEERIPAAGRGHLPRAGPPPRRCTPSRTAVFAPWSRMRCGRRRLAPASWARRRWPRTRRSER